MMKRPERKLNRLLDFDYSKDAVYFVTSCVKDKECVFGDVVNKEMQLNAYGQIALQQWDWLAEQYPYVILHAFVVMPNHVHGILEIDRPIDEINTGISPTQKSKTLSELMGVYKTTTSKLIRAAGLPEFAWQRSFHDHIIRHDRAYLLIRDYIQSNPQKWQEDVLYQQV